MISDEAANRLVDTVFTRLATAILKGDTDCPEQGTADDFAKWLLSKAS